MAKKNLWKETLEELSLNNLTWDDVLYVQGCDFQIPKDNFKDLAEKTDYMNEYGHNKIADDLTIVGENWWMDRGNYDGTEWWVFHYKPQPIAGMREVQTLSTAVGWENLWACNESFNNKEND